MVWGLGPQNKIKLNHVTTLNTSSCGLAVLSSTEPEEHVTGDSNGLQGEYSVFGFWDRLFLLATLNLSAGSTLYLLANAEITSYTCTQKDLPELFFTMMCVYGLCAYYILPVKIYANAYIKCSQPVMYISWVMMIREMETTWFQHSTKMQHILKMWFYHFL